MAAQDKEEITPRPDVEMIHLSLDFDPKAALAWATKEKFPWPTIPMDKIEDAGLAKLTPQQAPGYLLVDDKGTVLAKGKDAAFKKVVTLVAGKKG